MITIPDAGAYRVFAVMDDGESLCVTCVRDESNPVHVGGDADGWRIEGWSHEGEVDGTEERCAHCGRVIVEGIEELEPMDYTAHDANTGETVDLRDLPTADVTAWLTAAAQAGDTGVVAACRAILAERDTAD